jgi:hypothetical protein
MRAPTGWGLDPLTASFNEARSNQYATFANKRAGKHAVSIDRLLLALLADHIDTKPTVPLNFLLRAHSCYRAAASCVMAGQVYEATVLSRAVIESAAYGMFIGGDQAKTTLWYSRQDSASARERVRKEFGYGKLRGHFEKAHPRVAPAFTSLYEALIDFGAHPNEPGFSINMKLQKAGRSRTFDTIYMHEDGLPLDFGLSNLCRVGLWIVLAIRELYPEAYAERCEPTAVEALMAAY